MLRILARIIAIAAMFALAAPSLTEAQGNNQQHGKPPRRWAIGAALPALFLDPAYYYPDWATLGLAPPDPGFQWVRYGPDLLLVNITTGQVVDVIYDAFY